MWSKASFFFIFLVFDIHCINVNYRVPRFIGGSYTSTVTSTQIVTSIVPSSCILVDPTLQACRSVRYLSFPYFTQWQNTFNTTVIQAKSDDSASSSLGWGEYLGFYAPTVTVTQLELQTTVVKDPRIVVTYAVKGCRPQKLPEDLDSCETTQTMLIEEILPTSTVALPVTSSRYTHIPSNNETLSLKPVLYGNNTLINIIPNNGTIEGSANTLNENVDSKLPTPPLTL